MTAHAIPAIDPLTAADSGPRWQRFLSRWALLTSLVYLGLIVLFSTLILPAGRDSALPEAFLELDVAGRAPALYRMIIAFDVASWLAIGGLLLAWGTMLRSRAPLRATITAASSAAALIGFFGACVRLSATPDLAARYLAAPPGERGTLLAAYLNLQSLINVSFSAAGLLASGGLLLAASVAWGEATMPRWVSVLIGLGGGLGMAKGTLELATGADLGLVALLGVALLIAGFAGLAHSLRRAPAGQRERAGR